MLAGSGVYLLLRARTFDVVLGLTLLSYAVNLFIFVDGPARASAPPPILRQGAADAGHYADPLPQALVLTAIVISFAHDGAAAGAGAAQPSATTRRPIMSTARAGGDARATARARVIETHLIVAPVLLPLLAGALLLRRRAPSRRGSARRSALASALALLAIALAAARRAPTTAAPASTCSATGPRRSASCWCSTGSRR